ncbi:MAG: type IX secretion system protein PorQ [Prevotellaceae bacterium]|nr:type IX secretion system protein PorQ [Prevotellaceae bacterium]
MKKVVFALIALLSSAISMAQESQTEYNFLRIPVSAHAAALGGDNISVVENDVSLIFSNPALLCNASDKTIGLNYMNYMQGANTLSASYNFGVLDRGSVAVTGQFMDYGKMKETTSEGVLTGDFSAKDIALAGYFSYLLTDQISAGIAAKFITSYIGQYNSMGVGVDLGANWYNADSEWSVSATVKNLGGQIKAFEDDYEAMPIDIQLGVSKRLIHTPLRLHATLVGLNHLKQKFNNHLVLCADLILNESISLRCGDNYRRASEMSIGTGDSESSHGAGLSIGAGLNLERIKVNLAWGKYHVGSSSLMINLAYSL